MLKDVSPKKLLVLGIAAALTACGGSGSSSSDSSDHSSSESFTVTAIDGYLQNAEICVDANENEKCDDGEEILGETDENGQFEVPGAYRDSQLVVKITAGKTIDSDTGPVANDYQMSAPAGSEYLTPFTHLAAKQNDTLANIATSLGLDEELISGDFVGAKAGADSTDVDAAKIAHAVAIFLANQLQNDQDANANDLLTKADQVKTQAEDDLTNGDDPSEFVYEVGGSGDVTKKQSSGQFSEAMLAQDAFGSDVVWKMYVIHPHNPNDFEWGYAKFNINVEQQVSEFCFDNHNLYNNVPETPTFSEDCTPVSVSEDGRLIYQDTEKDISARLAYYSVTADGADEVTTMVLAGDSGELQILHNNPNIGVEDADDFTAENIVGTWYAVSDDLPSSSAIELLMDQRVYNSDNTYEFTLLGTNESIQGDWMVYELDLGDNDVLKGRHTDDASGDADARVEFLLYTDGNLRLIHDKKTNQTSGQFDAYWEGLFLESGNQDVIEKIYNIWKEETDALPQPVSLVN